MNPCHPREDQGSRAAVWRNRDLLCVSWLAALFYCFPISRRDLSPELSLGVFQVKIMPTSENFVQSVLTPPSRTRNRKTNSLPYAICRRSHRTPKHSSVVVLRTRTQHSVFIPHPTLRSHQRDVTVRTKIHQTDPVAHHTLGDLTNHIKQGPRDIKKARGGGLSAVSHFLYMFSALS